MQKLFNEFNTFLNFCVQQLPFINFDNPMMVEKLKSIHRNLVESDEKIIKSKIPKWVNSRFKFRRSGVNTINFWVDRGWGEPYANRKINEINEKNTKKLNEKMRNILNNSSSVFKYKSVVFNSKNDPKCGFCGNFLSYEKIFNRHSENKIMNKISGCSNNDCETHNMRLHGKYENYLPKGVWDDKKNELMKVIKPSNVLCTEYWINKGFTKEESIEEIRKIQSDRGKKVKGKSKKITKDYLRSKGFTEDEIKQKTLTPSKLEFWVAKGFTEEESIKKLRENQSYGPKFIDYKKRLLPSNIEYWVSRGFTKEVSKLKVKESQTTFSKEKCVQKYGERVGHEVFTQRQKKWQKSLNENGNLKIGYSKISQELFNQLLTSYDIVDKNGIHFATHNGEYRIDKNDGGVWLYDFTDVKNKKIIEYNGDDYHANPKKYLSEDKPHPFRKNVTAQEIWDKDDLKIKTANKNGFEVLIIWDSEYRWGDKDLVFKKCFNFLLK